MIISNILKSSPFTKINRNLVRNNIISTRLTYSTINNLKINDPLYKRQNDKNLPSRTNPLNPMIALSVFAFLTWGVFVQFSNNSERLNSSVVKELIRQSKFHPVTREILGNNIKPSSSDYPFLLNGLLGSTWVKGSISLMQGKVDISLRLEGSKGKGTIYFTSIRNSKEDDFNILRFKMIDDEGKHHNLISQSSLKDLETL